MRAALGKHAHTFGLMRLTFGVGARATAKYLFIHASDSIDSGRFSALKHGQASAVEPQMRDAVYKFAAFSATVHINSAEECTVENLVEKLRGVADSESINMDSFRAAVEDQKEQHPAEEKLKRERQDHADVVEKIEVPRAEVAEPEPVVIPEAVETASSKLKQERQDHADVAEKIEVPRAEVAEPEPVVIPEAVETRASSKLRQKGRAMDQMTRHAAVETAKQQAEQAGPAIFRGEEALAEVAKLDGLWDWALVGPDPIRLPLAGGGFGGIEEMRAALGKHAHTFGLMRLTFGVGARATAKYLFIHASDSIDSGRFSALKHGQASAVEPQMRDAVYKFAAFSATVHINSAEECTVENLVDKLRDVADSKSINMDSFRAAAENQKEQHPAEDKLKQERQDHAAVVEKMEVPRAEAAEAEPEVIPEAVHTRSSSKLRQKVKLFCKGDVVEIYSML